MTNRLRYRGLKGRQGDWLTEVTWEDGTTELLPTAHAVYYDGRTREYARLDDEPDHNMLRNPGKLKGWAEQLERTRKIILTNDDWHNADKVKPGPVRTGYVGVFDIADLEFHGQGEKHAFRVVGRYQQTAH